MSIAKRAWEYYRSGRVRRAYIGRNLVSLLIEGSTGQHTVIFDLRLGRYSCSCWGFTVHKRCKHVFCALLYLRDNYPQVFMRVARRFNFFSSLF